MEKTLSISRDYVWRGNVMGNHIETTMYKGIPSKGVEFFQLLFNSDEFCSELGKVALAAGKLEVEMILLFKRNNIKGKYSQATLGQLIDIGNRNGLFDDKLTQILKHISTQRNYFTHNIYGLFLDQVDETILPKKNLIDTDILTYSDYAWQLHDNLIGLTEVIQKIE